MRFKERVVQIMVHQESHESILDDGFFICIEDEGAGEFIKITSTSTHGSILFDPSEWKFLKKSIDKMVKKCK